MFLFCFVGKRQALTNSNNNNENTNPDMAPCENCGKLELKTKLKKKPFCSPICAKTAKTSPEENQLSSQISQTHSEEKKDKKNNTNGLPSDASNKSSLDVTNENGPASSTAAVSSIAPTTPPTTNPSATITTTSPAASSSTSIEDVPVIVKWTVSDVCEFIRNLPGCGDYAEDFENQEIDGQALLLLKENNLVSVMGMKLGPALKIVAKVESMKEGSFQEQ